MPNFIGSLCGDGSNAVLRIHEIFQSVRIRGLAAKRETLLTDEQLGGSTAIFQK
jgi:hypothetical protein